MISYGISHKGIVRKENQDAYINIDMPIGELDNLYVVADGMGGHLGGAMASKLAVDTIVEGVKNSKGSPSEIIQSSIENANNKIYQMSVSDGSLFGMGTTVDVLTIKDKVIYIGHVGDSRVYQIDNKNDLLQLTKDHSYVQELLDAGLINEEEAYHHPNKNRITRAVGVDNHINVDLISTELNQLDFVGFLLCSDGLTNMIENKEMLDILRAVTSIQERSEQLLQKALEYGGTDNITLILLENDKGGRMNA